MGTKPMSKGFLKTRYAVVGKYPDGCTMPVLFSSKRRADRCAAQMDHKRLVSVSIIKITDTVISVRLKRPRPTT